MKGYYESTPPPFVRFQDCSSQERKSGHSHEFRPVTSSGIVLEHRPAADTLQYNNRSLHGNLPHLWSLRWESSIGLVVVLLVSSAGCNRSNPMPQMGHPRREDRLLD